MKKLMIVAVFALLIMAFAAPAASADGPAKENGSWYTVKHGDTLTGIAYYHGVKVSRLVYANDIKDPNHIYKGQWLWIPYGQGKGYDNGYDKGQSYDKGYNKGYDKGQGYDNGYGKGYGYQSCNNYHHVYRGETLSGIAYKYGVSAWDIAQANHMYNLNHVYAGTYICIPAGHGW